MSTDYEAVCHACKVTWHLGQFMGGTYSFGFGSKDKAGQELSMGRISEHCAHGNVEIMFSDAAPDGYTYLDFEDFEKEDCAGGEHV